MFYRDSIDAIDVLQRLQMFYRGSMEAIYVLQRPQMFYRGSIGAIDVLQKLYRGYRNSVEAMDVRQRLYRELEVSNRSLCDLISCKFSASIEVLPSLSHAKCGSHLPAALILINFSLLGERLQELGSGGQQRQGQAKDDLESTVGWGYEGYEARDSN